VDPADPGAQCSSKKKKEKEKEKILHVVFCLFEKRNLLATLLLLKRYPHYLIHNQKIII